MDVLIISLVDFRLCSRFAQNYFDSNTIRNYKQLNKIRVLYTCCGKSTQTERVPIYTYKRGEGVTASGVKSKTKNTEKNPPRARVCSTQHCCRHAVNNKGVFTGHGKGLYVQKTSWTETPSYCCCYCCWSIMKYGTIFHG